MKTIWNIFKRDISRLSHNLVAMIVISGVCLIPSLYAWFNIAANYDPYSNTANIKIAISNNDDGTRNDITGYINLGNEVVANLADNHDLGWVFVNKNQAIDGVKSGKYYASIIIDSDFSESMVSILSGEIHRPKLEYYINEKKNAIAPKITDTGATTIQEQINEQFISATSKAVSEKLGESIKNVDSQISSTQDNIKSKLNDVSDNINKYILLLNQLNSTLDSKNTIIPNINTILDNVDKSVELTNNSINDGNDLMSKSRDSIDKFSDAISGNIENSDNTLTRVSNSVRDDLKDFNRDLQDISGNTLAAIDRVQTLALKNAEIIKKMKELDEKLPNKPLSKLIQRMENENQRHQQFLDELQDGNSSISNAANKTESTINQINQTIQDGKDQIKNTKDSFQQDTLPQIENSLDTFSDLSNRLSSSLSGIKGSTQNMRILITMLDKTLDDTKIAMNSASDSIPYITEMIDGIKADLNIIESTNIYQNIMLLSDANADDISEFMYSPVEIKTESFYSVKTYGSAMTPFYTNLAIWVGGIVLIAIFKMEVYKDEKINNFTASQAYFGRWILFVIIGLIQAFIICMGDIYLIKAQCENKVHFVVAGLVASFVYVNLIYALSLTFKHVGKALSVLLVILQIPGSSGTYPIEMTPNFFRAIHPFLPFTYGINAMREASAGIYGNHYVKNLILLSLFLPVAFLIGLVLRPLILNFNNMFDRRLLETDLMICEEDGMVRNKIKLSTAVKILSEQQSFKQMLNKKIDSFEARYPKMIRRGLLAVVIIPILVLTLMFSISSKMILLILWIASIIGIVMYIIVVEYIHESLQNQKRIINMTKDEILSNIKSKQPKAHTEKRQDGNK